MLNLTIPPSEEKGKAEINLIQYGLGPLGKKRNFQSITIRGQKGRTLIISPSADWGLPTYFEHKLFILWTCQTAEQNCPQKVYLNPYKDAQTLRVTPNNEFYKRWRRALKTFLGLTILSQGMWYDAKTKKQKTYEKGFHLVEHYVTIRDAEEEDEAKELLQNKVYGFLVWGKPYWKNIKAGYLATFDKSLFLSLNPAAGLAYLRTSVYLWKEGSYTFDLFDFCDHIQFAVNREPRKKKSEFNRYVAKPILEGGGWSEIHYFKKNGYWKFTVKAAEKTHIKMAPSVPAVSKMTKSNRNTPSKAAESSTVGEFVFKDENHFTDIWEALTGHYSTSEKEINIWGRTLEDLSLRMSKANFSLHFLRSILLSLTVKDGEAQALIGLPNDLSVDWVSNRWNEKVIESLLKFIDAEDVEVTYVTPKSEHSTNSELLN